MLALEAKEKLLKDLDKTVLKVAVGKSLLNGVKILAGGLKSNLRKTVGARTNRSLSGFFYFGVYNDYLLAQPPADLRKKDHEYEPTHQAWLTTIGRNREHKKRRRRASARNGRRWRDSAFGRALLPREAGELLAGA